MKLSGVKPTTTAFGSSVGIPALEEIGTDTRIKCRPLGGIVEAIGNCQRPVFSLGVSQHNA